MRARDAKAIPLSVLLAALGHEPVRNYRGEWWYCSPLRQEKTASFKLSVDEKAWYDNGLHEGGNIIDFAMRYFQTDVAGALWEIEQCVRSRPAKTIFPLFGETANPAHITVTPSAPMAAQKPSTEAFDVTIKPLETSTLCNYLRNQRHVDLAVAQKYVQEVWFKMQENGRWLFALAFPNDSGGYEWRNASDTKIYKRAWGRKDISTIFPASGETTAVMVFEGFMDFLSALTYYQVAAPKLPVIVLNGVVMKDKALAAIRDLGAEKVYLYLDRDEGGLKLTADFQAALADLSVLDKSELYAGFKDFNAFLQKHRHVEHSP